MANAAVEKLKSFGLHHGEKVGVGLAATLMVVFIGAAVQKPVLELQPQQLTKSAESVESNLRQRQKDEDILAKLEEKGLKNPGFLAMVDNQTKNALNPNDYKAKLDWVTPEPGAGLIRDQPELIAPVELVAFPGRGAMMMFALNDKGERVVDEAASKNNMLGMGGMPGGMPGAGGRGNAKALEEAERRRKAEEKRLKASLAGDANATKEKEEKSKQEAQAPAPSKIFKEETKGQRWVTITAVLDHAKLKQNWANALKTPLGVAAPNYYDVDIERRQKTPEGQWTEWAMVDRNRNYQVLDNITDVSEELVPDDRRFEALVDPLPFLRAGYWSGVHVTKLVPVEARTVARTNDMGMGMGMGMGGGMIGMSSGSDPSVGMGGGGKMSGGMGSGMGMGMGMGGEMGSMSGGGSGMGMGGPGAEGPAEDQNYTRSEQPELMIRKLDFSVDPDTTYEFRLRIQVVNPNKGRTDVNPGVDTETEHLIGPWSEPTSEITVPADVSAYALGPITTERRNDIVQFQIMKWDRGSGQTLVKTDDATPGQVVGEFGTIQVPSSEGKGPSNSNIDFNAQVILLDSTGGPQMLPTIKDLERNRFDIPAIAMVIRSDGSVAIRDQGRDRNDQIRVDMENTYRQAIQDSTKKRQPRGGMSGGGMPGS